MGGTLTEVAKAAGVSLATASRALNQPDRLSASTRTKVLQVAQELDYTRKNQQQNGKTFGVVMRDMTNPVIASQLEAIQDMAWLANHRILVVGTSERVEREQEVLETLPAEVSGLMLISPRTPARKIKELVGSTPVTVINSDTSGFCPSVMMSANKGIAEAVEHLSALGHRQLTHVPGPQGTWATQNRINAIKEQCSKHEINLKIVGHQSATINGGRSAAPAVVASRSTAVIAYNDLVAMGLQVALKELGKDCPVDISIIGMDALEVGTICQPKITSIRLNVKEAPKRAFKMLLDISSGKLVPPIEEHLTSNLVPRESTGFAN